MATRAATQLQTYTPSPSPDGFVVEVWRLDGGTVGDTCVVTPKRGRFVKRVVGALEHNLATTGTDTQVTFTYLTGGSTSLSFDVEVISQP